ncbi:MAG: phytoene desaturase family protein [Candidatus Zhuqueibacterota bacterium]
MKNSSGGDVDKNVVVIGGGIGGLSAAIRLAREKYHVSLFERNSSLGGKMNQWKHRGFRFDTGPSLITLPFVIDELFADVDENRDDYFQFVPIDPICRYFWSDGTVLDASSDELTMRAELAKISPGDAQNYRRFLSYSKTIYDITADIFLYSPIHEFSKIARLNTLVRLFQVHRIDPFRTVHQGVTRFFMHPKIVQLFDRYATYNGSNPFQAPATLNIIPYVEYGMGSFYIKSGIYTLVESLTAIAEKLGVQFFGETPVEKILHDTHQVRGVVVNGETIAARNVVANSDVVTTFNHLIDGFPARRDRLNKVEPSLSGLVFLWGVSGNHPGLAQHNIIFSDDYETEFGQIFEKKTMPDDPTIYITITSITDAHHAPANCENWFVLVNAPYLSENTDWTRQVERTKHIVLEKLKRLKIDIASGILTENVLTPEDFYQRYGSNRGSIYGISSNDRTTAFRRPANRDRSLKGLYFAGGSTHPGGGVPLTVLSGKMGAELLMERNK